MIVVAHRLFTVVDFGKILVLESGRGVEFGTPKELFLRKGHFGKLVSHSLDEEELSNIILGNETG